MSKISKENEKGKLEMTGWGFVDIGKYSHWAYAESPKGKTLKVFEFENNKKGSLEVRTRLDEFREEEGLDKLRIGVESTGSYGEPIIDQIRKQEGIEVVGVNPKHMKRVKEVVDNSPNKTDKKDPRVGTMLVRIGRTQRVIRPQGLAAELRMMSKHRKQLKASEIRIMNQLESQVVRIFPEFLVQMKGLRTKSAIYLLEHYPMPAQLVELGVEQLTRELKQVSCYQLGEQRAKALHASALASIGVKSGVIGIGLAINDLAQQLKLVRRQVKEIESMLKDSVIQHQEANYLLSVPQLGPITVSEIIGETGGLNNYSDASKLIKLCGFNLYQISSGVFKGKMRISKRGRSTMRHSLYLAALRLIKKNGVFEKHYKKYLEGMKKPQAVVAVAKKLLRVLFGLVKHQQMFDPAKVAFQHSN